MGLDLSWLPPKENKAMENGRGLMAVEERNTHESSNSSSSSSSSSRSVSNLFSSIGSNNFVFRDSDSRSSLSNESVDDNKKRRFFFN